MFKSTQIISASALLKHYKEVIGHLHQNPQAVLITQRNGRHLVLVNVEIFEEMLEKNLKADGLFVPPNLADLMDKIEI